MFKDNVDLLVIGAGSGGTRAARIAAGFGAKVLVAEEHRVGGTCVIRGCVPKKLMVYASEFSHSFETAAGFGWQIGHASWRRRTRRSPGSRGSMSATWRTPAPSWCTARPAWSTPTPSRLTATA